MISSNNNTEIEPQKRNERSITIGQLVESVTKMTGQRCTSAMIYNYLKQGLIPEPKRTEGGFRLFSLEDIQRVACIKHWQTKDLSLVEIKERLKNFKDEFALTEELAFLPVDRHSQILEAAEIIFPQKGYNATTLQDVANQAGISSSTIYQHFDSKEELFLALIDNLNFAYDLEQINLALESEEHISFEEVRQALITVAHSFLESHTANAEIIRMFIAEARQFPEVGESYCRHLVIPVEDLLEHYLSQQMDRGVLQKTDVKLAVHAFYGIFLNFVVTQQLLKGEGIIFFPDENRVPQLVDIFLNGLKNPSH
ncbi:MAG: TetR family transcriptional regulator [Anaerolineaceae bacterium]|nr:TetR family transcriptional regulator [Anaerolineaceae bacterium]